MVAHGDEELGFGLGLEHPAGHHVFPWKQHLVTACCAIVVSLDSASQGSSCPQQPLAGYSSSSSVYPKGKSRR